MSRLQEEQVADLVAKFKRGSITRREFIAAVSVLGGLTAVGGTIATLLKSSGLRGALTGPVPAAAAGMPKRGGTLTAATIDKPVNMDPAFAELYSSMQVYQNIFSKLVYVDRNYKFVPGLAKSWRQVNATTWEFDLVDNAWFHNGDKFSAADVKYTFDRLFDKKLGAANAVFFTPTEGVEVVSPTRVRIVTKPNWGGLIPTLAAVLEVVNKRAIESADPKLQPVGTGPFRFLEWVKDDHITLERWDKYFKPGMPPLDRVIFKAIANDTVRLTGLQKGEINWIEQVPLQMVDQLKKAGAIKANPNGAFFPDLFLINCTKPPFDKVEVRQALSWALDRKAIARLVWFGQAMPSAEALAPTNPLYSGVDPYEGAPNVAKAKALLAKAGYPQGLKAIFAAQPQVPTQVQVGQLIQQMTKQAGIDIEVRSFESARWFEELATKRYDFTSTYWSATLDPEHCYFPLGHSQSPWNFAGYKDEQLDRALEKFRFTVDPVERKKAYAEVVRLTALGAPVVFQVNFLRTYWTQSNVEGVATLPSLELRMEDAWYA